MEILVLIVLTVLSCILFDISNVSKHVKDLVTSYRHQFALMTNKAITDEEKQKRLLAQVSNQIMLLLKLIGGIILFVAPFLSLFVLGNHVDKMQPDILITWQGIVIPIVTVILYMLTKRFYGKLFK